MGKVGDRHLQSGFIKASGYAKYKDEARISSLKDTLDTWVYQAVTRVTYLYVDTGLHRLSG